jgi:hypothetical protein
MVKQTNNQADLWDSSWLSSQITKVFQKMNYIDRQKIKTIAPIINSTESDVFAYY